MKISILLSLLSLLSFTAYSEESCLKITMPDQSLEFLCGHVDASKVNLFSYNELEICFVGSARMLTEKINSHLFQNSDDGISDAVTESPYKVSMTFWNLGGKTVSKTINKCE